MAELNCTHRACSKCLVVKPIDEFHKNSGMASGRLNACRRCVIAANVKRNQTPEQKAKRAEAFSKKWREDPEFRARQARAGERYFSRADVVEKMRLRASERRRSEPERIRALARELYKKKRLDPSFVIATRIRNGLRHSLRGIGKSRRAFEILGYSVEQLTVHLERQFTKGMTWKNMGQWHIDHIVPLSSFGIKSEEDPALREAWALSNLRPIWAVENMRKHAKRTHLV